MSYHEPVMARECLEGLNLKSDGVYVDVTFGGGGHSRLILEQLGKHGRLYGFDQDPNAAKNQLDDPCFTFIPFNFRYAQKMLRLNGVRRIDGLLADLGVSSHQFDQPERGFSFRFEAKLDMRMNTQDNRDARTVLNEYSAEALQQLFSRYGEVRNARTVAQAIVANRPVHTVQEFLEILEPLVRGQRNRYLAQVFQALRIEVNDEMAALNDLLDQSIALLKPGGRLVAIAYHSLEDRLVKNYFKSGNPEGRHQQDTFGNIYRPFKPITKKALTPGQKELERNSRARSAKLRIGERTEQ